MGLRDFANPNIGVRNCSTGMFTTGTITSFPDKITRARNQFLLESTEASRTAVAGAQVAIVLKAVEPYNRFADTKVPLDRCKLEIDSTMKDQTKTSTKAKSGSAGIFKQEVDEAR